MARAKQLSLSGWQRPLKNLILAGVRRAAAHIGAAAPAA